MPSAVWFERATCAGCVRAAARLMQPRRFLSGAFARADGERRRLDAGGRCGKSCICIASGIPARRFDDATTMNAYCGRRYSIVSADSDAVTLDSLNPPGTRLHVLLDDRHLLFKPDRVDFEMAEAFERGEIEAFEYPDGHTYPPGREIPKPRPRDVH